MTDTNALIAHAQSLGVAAALVLPPWFYPSSEAGLLAWFEAVFTYAAPAFERSGGATPLLLYHIPRMTRAPVSPALVGPLARRFPGLLAGVKDSDGDWTSLEAVCDEHPELSVFAGDERLLLRLLRHGGRGGGEGGRGRGAVLARGCVAGPYLARLIALAQAEQSAAAPNPEADELQAWLGSLRETIAPFGTVPALKALVSALPGLEGPWCPRPPLLPLPPERRPALLAAVAALGEQGEALAASFAAR